MSDKPKNLSDIDNFWDLESLLPKKRPVIPSARHSNTDTVELSVGSDVVTPDKTAAIPPKNGSEYHREHSSSDTARRLNELSMKTKAQEYRSKPLDPYLIYEPKGGLIRRVEVSAWNSRFNFYENFSTDIKRLWSRTSTPCDHVSFFSYVPQYSQLKYAQLKWYLWWRDNIRRGVYLKTDFCYILLFIYEIINAHDLIPPTDGLSMLCSIWLNYRTEHRRLDSYMCDWLCDYCLVHALPCPTKELEPILGDVVAAANFKEFYIDEENGSTAAGLLSYSSTYDWRKSRYVTPENVVLFAKHIKAAFEKAYREILSEKDDTLAKSFRMERTAYDGALCVYNMKRSIAVEYISYTRSPKFRFVVTDIIKYSENRIRMALGIKSRLKVESLTDKLKACIDEYFDQYLPIPKKKRNSDKSEADSAKAAYDKLYEPVTTSLSLENALEIEKKSWNTTDILTAAFEEAADDEKITETASIPSTAVEDFSCFSDTAPASSDGEDEFATFICAVDEHSKKALSLLCDGNSNSLCIVSAQLGILPDALADRINEVAFDIIGDSVIESDGDGYRLISDYEGDIKKWLK